MITVYGWRPGPDGAIEIKTTRFNPAELEKAMRWLRNCKMPCKAYSVTPEEDNAIRLLLWNH